MNRVLGVVVAISLLGSISPADDPPLRLIFLGDQGPHEPGRRAAELMPALARRGIDVTYSDDVSSTLTRSTLNSVDGLIVYANIDTIEPDQADALLGYVADGGGFIPLHCASYCFRNNPNVVALIGAQFQRHGTGVFRVRPADLTASHPIMKGYESFQSWDETYVHTLHNEQNRTVLEYRPEGDDREPWTWIRTHGQGRVFYTAWGHDRRTFTNPGFHNLVERGIRWACGQDLSGVPEFRGGSDSTFSDVTMTEPRDDVRPFEYIDVGPKIPNYIRSRKWGEQEPPKTVMQKPLTPAESIKHYRVPQGFSLELFASEPDLGGKPICISWDHRGRLWVAETYDYPNEKQPEGKGRDRIRICEDTDGDHVADKFTVFAEGLSIPTSIAFSHGGVIVHQAPETLFLRDTDGDDVADQRKVLLSGWSTGDTHAGPSHLNYGHDDWFYGIVGYAAFDGEIAGKPRSFRTGFYRFKVDSVGDEVEVTDFEFLRNTNNNSWGVGFSEEGLLFGSTANRNPSEFMPIANRHYERVRGWTSSVLTGIADTHEFQPITDKVRQVDHHGGYTAAAGHALYTARRYPPQYWNRTAFVAGPTGHLVGTFVLKRDGAGFMSASPANLLASDDEWSAPIMAEVGPDGNVWVIDWYNYIVQHNPTPIGFEKGPGNAYMTDLRDKTHGRIYRVVYGRDDPSRRKSLEGATSDELVQALASDNMFWRRHAQRILIERKDTSVTESLNALIKRQELDALGLDVAAIHAVRTLRALEALDHSILRTALDHPSPGVVRAALESAARNAWNRDAIIKGGSLVSPDAQVRLSALLALAEMPPSRPAATAALDALTQLRHRYDRSIQDAATSLAATNGGEFLVLCCRPSAAAEGLAQRVAIVAEHVARSEDAAAVRLVIPRLPETDLKIASAIITGWSNGWPKSAELTLSSEHDASLLKLFHRLETSGQGQLVRLATRWSSKSLGAEAERIANELLELSGSEDLAVDERIEAARQLVALMDRDADTAAKLLDIVSPRTQQKAALGIINALRESRADGLGAVMLDRVSALTPGRRSEAFRVMLSRPATTQSLLSAIDQRRISRQDLSLDQQQALLAHPTKELRERAARVFAASGGLPSPDRQKVLASYIDVTRNSGDVARGKVVFTKHCANCHLHSGEGAKVGPDLTGMAVHPKAELLTHILDPSSSVEGNYRSYAVLTFDGVVVNGMLASETETAIEIFDAQGKKQTLLREEIERLVSSDKSVMPEGFEKQIDRRGFTDLLEFLTAKGKFVPLPIDKAATVVSTRGMFHDGDDGADRLVFEDWTAKTVGQVPFLLTDPNGKRTPNVILLNGPRGTLPPKMPKSVRVPCNASVHALHLLGGVSGWGYPAHGDASVSMIVRLHLEDGSSEDHELVNGQHFADYIRRVDVPGSKFAMMVRGQQLRHVVVHPQSDQVVREIEFVKGDDPTAPIIVSVTAQTVP